MFEQLVDRLKRKTRAEEDEIQFGTFEETTDAEEVVADAPVQAPVSAPQEAPAIQTRQSDNIELKVVRPETYSDVSTVADHLLRGCTVVLNLEVMDRASILRMLDFLNGVTYATDGEIKKVAPNTYIVTAHGVDVTDAE
ncbi:MAG: cell division protein SepF [Clostridia bacterium]|nr:cell division protein SepF [Clostridia bacterium]